MDLRRLLEQAESRIADDWEDSRRQAANHDANRAGNQAEDTWRDFLGKWGPFPPGNILSRRYIAGPGGESGEVDIVVVKPSYPAELRGQTTVLSSGVAAAFSVKLTYEARHLRQAIEQKLDLARLSQHKTGDPHSELVGAFPFGLLAHAVKPGADRDGAGRQVQDTYSTASSVVSHPREELDCVLVADSCFLSMTRTTLSPFLTGGDVSSTQWLPATGLMLHDVIGQQVGSVLARFLVWWHDRHAQMTSEPSALEGFADLWGPPYGEFERRRWGMDVYSENLRGDLSRLHGPGRHGIMFQ